MLYRVVCADAPWRQTGGQPVAESWGGGKRGADQKYPTMRVDEIAAMPVRSMVRRDAHLWFWTIDEFLEPSFHIIRRWGFRFVRTMVWNKVTSKGEPSMGLGQYLRGSHELCLFAVRGSLPYARTSDGGRVSIPSQFSAPRGRHSEKPERSYEIIEQVSPFSPKLELFARKARPGWTAMGNETDGTVF